MKPRQTAYILIGTTAAGKSAIAHHLAKRHNLSVISADSMAVYKHMDIGTAKPSQQECQEINYHGINLIEPDHSYSTGEYYAYIKEIPSQAQPFIVVGGTGLYIKTLLCGLDPSPPAIPSIRNHAEQLFQEKGLSALQSYAQHIAPDIYTEIKDPKNPRRVIRAIERSQCSAPPQQTAWTNSVDIKIIGIRWPRDILLQRIEERVYSMYKNGLMDEAAYIRKQFQHLSKTALQAIGYQEAYAVLDGTMTQEQAIEKTIIRTRQFSKRQNTWFRNQLHVSWVDTDTSLDLEQVAEKIWNLWQADGATPLAL